MFYFQSLLEALAPCPNHPADLMGKAARITPPPNDSFSLAEILDDPALLGRFIDRFDLEQNAPRRSVAVSLVFKRLALATLGFTLTHALYGQPVPRDKHKIYLTLDGEITLHWQPEDAQPLDRGEIVIASEQLAWALVAHFNDHHDLGISDAWGSAGLAIASPWMKLREWRAPAEVLLLSYNRFIQQLRPELQAAMLALPLNKNGREYVHFRRRKSCCHKYELPQGEKCATCSQTPMEIQIRQFLQQME